MNDVHGVAERGTRGQRARRTAARVVAAVLAGAAAGFVPVASMACGCFHSPMPEGVEDEFAVNQRAEQILFEVEGGMVTAHVFIQYAGDPASFAWILPVPAVPDLDLSPNELFALLDATTRPRIQYSTTSLCPPALYRCAEHPPCPTSAGEGSPGLWDEAADAGAAWPDPSPRFEGTDKVEVLQQEVVGDYSTVVFAADEADAAVDWLIDNGFIVNETMSPYMQPYLDMKMLFVAAKLLAGKGTDGIKPLRLTFPSEKPMIPLVLTAPAADPHMTVLTWVASDVPFRPDGVPELEVDPDQLSPDPTGRDNYPMVLARIVDEAGGHAFVTEWRGFFPDLTPNAGDPCCASSWDGCGLAGNGVCECPGAAFDLADCEASVPELLKAIELGAELRARHAVLTRMVSRISPEEMTFDPVFEPTPSTKTIGVLRTGKRYHFSGCEADVTDGAELARVQRRMECTAVYCGPHGDCVPTDEGPACACVPGFAAQTFSDLDGLPSVTC